MVSRSEAFAAASKMIAEGRPMSEVTASFRALRTTDKYEQTPLAMAVESFISKYAPRDRDMFRTTVTEAAVSSLRDGSVKLNPAQTGLTVGDGEVQLRFDNIRDVSGPLEAVAILQQEGFSFPTDRPPIEYVTFAEVVVPKDGAKHSKFSARLMCDKRAVDSVSGDAPLTVDGHSICVRVCTAGVMKNGLVQRLEGSIVTFVKQCIMLGMPMQAIFWQVVLCLHYYGIPCRSVYLDDAGQARRNCTTDSQDFQLHAEFFSKSDALAGAMIFDQLISHSYPKLFTGFTPASALLTAEFTLKQGQAPGRNDAMPVKVMIKTPMGMGIAFKERVEEACGDSTKASVVKFLTAYLKKEAPALDPGRIEPECYAGSTNVNFNFAVGFLYPRGEFKSALELYARFGTRSTHAENKRLDYLRNDKTAPFTNIKCEVWRDGRPLSQYPECGQMEETDARKTMDLRGCEADPMTYFEHCWSAGMATSPHEGRMRMLERAEQMGQKVADPPAGTTPGKLLGDSRERMSLLLESDPEGASMLIAEPMHQHFWRFSDPYIEPQKRGAPPVDPMEQALLWKEALWEVSPELILPAEWAAVPTPGPDFQKARHSLQAVIGRGTGWLPAPAMNCLPIQPPSVPTPEGEMGECDLRKAWMQEAWGANPSALYKAVASCIEDGVLIQVREMSGLVLSPGPMALRGNLKYFQKEPALYTTGSGMQLREADARWMSARIVQLVEERGVILVPAQYYRKDEIPPHLVHMNGADEDLLWTHLKSHLWYEANHFGFILSYTISGGQVHQLASPVAGGIYLLSPTEQAKRLKAGISDTAYAPVPYALREVAITGRREKDHQAEILIHKISADLRKQDARAAASTTLKKVAFSSDLTGKSIIREDTTGSAAADEDDELARALEEEDARIEAEQRMEAATKNQADAEAAEIEARRTAAATAQADRDLDEAMMELTEIEGASAGDPDSGPRERVGGHLTAKQRRDVAKARELAKKGAVRGPIEHRALAHVQAIVAMQQALDRHSARPPTDATLGADTIVGEVDQLQRPAWSNASRTLELLTPDLSGTQTEERIDEGIGKATDRVEGAESAEADALTPTGTPRPSAEMEELEPETETFRQWISDYREGTEGEDGEGRSAHTFCLADASPETQEAFRRYKLAGGRVGTGNPGLAEMGETDQEDTPMQERGPEGGSKPRPAKALTKRQEQKAERLAKKAASPTAKGGRGGR